MFHLIINPTAGNGRTLKVQGPVESELFQRGHAFKTHITERAGHATEIARRLVGLDDESNIVVLGGDGTFNEVANGLKGSRAILYFVSCGTGNDLVKALGLPRDPIEALRIQLSSTVRTIDAGQINDHLFLNMSGTGFDIEVLRQTERFRTRFKGIIAYLLGLLTAIRRFRPIEAKITVAGKTFIQSLTLFEVANGRYFGGGMQVAPKADPTDGLFDIIYIDAVEKTKILQLLPSFLSGKFLSLPIVHTLRTNEILIECDGMTVNFDGELRQTDRAHFRMIPGGLRIACP